MLRRLARLLGPEEVAAAAADLESLEAAGRLPAWLEELARAAETLPLPEVPAVVTQDLRQMFDEAALVELQHATLIRDSRTQPRLAGVRGATGSEGWSMSYTSAAADVVIDVWWQLDGSLNLEGHVMEHHAAESAYRARISGPVEANVDGDRLGRFEVTSLPPGQYTIQVGNGVIELQLEADLGETES
jgi:hypothetical protein